ncbi:MAG: response regulator [Hyphomicrobiales bacterium]
MERSLRSARVELLDQCLVVEDDSIIRLDLEETLRGFGLKNVHGASTLEVATAIIASSPIRFAVLDYVIGSSNTVAVAEVLAARGVPTLFLTAHGKSVELPAGLAHLQVLSKPFSSDLLAAAILKELAALTPPPDGDACEGRCCV